MSVAAFAPSDRAMRRAMRAHLVSLVVATTDPDDDLSATASGYARTTGSFLDEGFEAGMELVPSGFTQTTLGVVGTGATATTLPIVGGRTVQSSGAGRSLTVGLPAIRFYENILNIERVSGRPYVVEQYDPGPTFVTEVGDGARQEARPMYTLLVHIKEGVGADAAQAYAEAISAHFLPGTHLSCADGTVLRVRSDQAPSKKALLPAAVQGWFYLPVTISFSTLN